MGHHERVTRRWNGWGDDAVATKVPREALSQLETTVGAGRPTPDALLADVIETVPASRLPSDPLVSTDPEDRIRHARGQSLGDWIALRSGQLGRVPDGVARPTSADEVRVALDLARSIGARVVPYGGGTTVVGGLAPADLGQPGSETPPILVVSLERLASLRDLDETSGLATFGAGIAGPALEAALRPSGRMLGHEPQSFEFSTLGGWVVTRSSGQRSLGFGRMEALFAGGRLEAPAGRLDLPTNPMSAAGPDLRQLVLGSEGRLGILAEATVRTVPIPEYERTLAVFIPDWESGLAAVRALAGVRLPLTMIRLSTPAETRTTLALAGHRRRVGLAMRWLGRRGAGPDPCLLLFGVAGRTRVAEAAAGEASKVLRKHGGVPAPGAFARAWDAGRFRGPYLRNALWDAGYAVDTLETAVDWTRAPALAAALVHVLDAGLEAENERVHAVAHLSHVYPSGTSIYLTYVFRRSPRPEGTFRRWLALKTAASRTIVEHGATISHQHGVGRDHVPYLAVEKGELGMAALRQVIATFDPDGLMDPGVLVGDGASEPSAAAGADPAANAASGPAT
jgi:alkyldihydroxyacetonephosphate synthase